MQTFVPQRKILRLPAFDYTQNGGYFVTLCAANRACLFGHGVSNQIVVNEAGQMLWSAWQDLPNHYPEISLDAFVVMPNHLHGVILINQNVGAALVAARRESQISLPKVLNRFKSSTTVQYIDGVKHKGWQAFEGKIWQRGYYDRIIRDEADLIRIREYIADNPRNWDVDSENPLS